MKVIKRNGNSEDVNFQKILIRIIRETYGLDMNYVEPVNIAKTVIDGLYDGVTTTELDKLAMETAASMTAKHPDYGLLAGRLAVSALHKETPNKFSKVVKLLYKYVDPKSNQPAPLLTKELYEIVMENPDAYDNIIQNERDFTFDFFGFKTLEKSYLLRLNGKPIERPQYLYLRVALAMWKDNIEKVKESYDMLSLKEYTNATPTLFNAGIPNGQYSSCFLLSVQDSIEHIADNIKDCMLISKNAGGIGFDINNIRAKGSYIKGTNGTSNGIVPMLRSYNNLALYIDQGGNKRKGSWAAYISPTHPDVIDFLDLKKTHGQEDLRARDLFYAMWIPDIFMRRVEADAIWSLFDPSVCPLLNETYGEEYDKLYEQYEIEGKFSSQIKARKVWEAIIKAQIETGTPYILYKDAINKANMQSNVGIIRSSNLCTEIVQPSGNIKNPKTGEIQEHISVCNLCSIALSQFVNEETKTYDHEALFKTTYNATLNLNRVIDINNYPNEKAKISNTLTRPIGVGVQGLHDAFFKMDMAFDSEEARQLNAEIFETMYAAAITASSDLAEKDGSYDFYKGSPWEKGLFQFDFYKDVKFSGRYDWEKLKERVKSVGIRNSQLLTCMPTQSTASILGNVEACEAITSNLYKRQVLSGEFLLVNKYLVKDLIKENLWSDELRIKIIQNYGSVQNIPEIPLKLRNKYKTVWEISQKVIIDQAKDRTPFIDQSQSMNLFIASPNIASVSSMHFYAWKAGLKTGMYYLKSKGSTEAIQFSTGKNAITNAVKPSDFKIEVQGKVYNEEEALMCSIDSPDDCIVCSS